MEYRLLSKSGESTAGIRGDRFGLFRAGLENLLMLIRATRKRLSPGVGGQRTTKRYVVTPSINGRVIHLAQVLRAYPKVVLLDKVDDSTALVEMSDRDLDRLSRQHPELAIEPNLPYQKAK